MPRLRQVPPGRAGTLWLRHRLAVARRGCGVLRRKLTMLTEERERLRRRYETTAAEWARADRVACGWLRRAAVLDGADVVGPAGAGGPMTVVPRWTALMGVRYAAPPGIEPPHPPAGWHAPGGSATSQAALTYRAAAEAAARHAASSSALSTVDEEVSAVRQRVRMLEQHWIPRLEDALVVARQQMDEQEAADGARRRARDGRQA
ncbi:V-type ATP synthase subunit D [Dactylosporangium sucinum]|uniref:V-type ATP synthase subunit D n=1 Tax=Dactylosporangium sucinum TaxID=1424081 RepID=UPI00167EBC36|nr:V-type ATP synthase subunit D [Dactylosporangium sucinum]